MVATWWHATKCSIAMELVCEPRPHPLLVQARHARPAVSQARPPGAAARIGHLPNGKIGHSSNRKTPQMPDACEGFLLYHGGSDVQTTDDSVKR